MLSNVAGLVDSIGLVELIVVDVERRVVIVVTKLKSVNYEGSLTRIKDGNSRIAYNKWYIISTNLNIVHNIWDNLALS